MELFETNGEFTYFIVGCITGKMGMRPKKQGIKYEPFDLRLPCEQKEDHFITKSIVQLNDDPYFFMKQIVSPKDFKKYMIAKFQNFRKGINKISIIHLFNNASLSSNLFFLKVPFDSEPHFKKGYQVYHGPFDLYVICCTALNKQGETNLIVVDESKLRQLKNKNRGEIKILEKISFFDSNLKEGINEYTVAVTIDNGSKKLNIPIIIEKLSSNYKHSSLVDIRREGISVISRIFEIDQAELIKSNRSGLNVSHAK